MDSPLFYKQPDERWGFLFTQSGGRVQLADACTSNNRARTTGGWVEDRVCEGTHAS